MFRQFVLSRNSFSQWVLFIGVLISAFFPANSLLVIDAIDHLQNSSLLLSEAAAAEDELLLFMPALASKKSYLLINSKHLAALKQKMRTNAPEWVALRNNVDERMGTVDYYKCSPENIALVYLLTRDPKYAAAAFMYAEASMLENVRFDSYLRFGDYMRRAALVLNYCWDALTPAQRTQLADYLNQWTNELWFNNQGSGYGLNDPGDNYHMAFLEGTAFAGYALRQAGHPNAGTYISLLLDKLNRPDGVLNYLNTRVPGGDWNEGVNYGQRSKQRLFAALAVIASMTGDNYFQKSDFFPNSIYYAHYQLQPGNVKFYPGGDLALTTDMRVGMFDRDYMQIAVFHLPDSEARRYGQWYLEQIISAYTVYDPSSDSNTPFYGLYYKDMLYKLSLPSLEQNTLPVTYRAAGTDWLNFRTGWNPAATCVSIAGSPRIDALHGHHDVGSFSIWKHSWLTVDANYFDRGGILWEPGSHNMLHVDGAERRLVPSVPGLSFYHDSPQIAYVHINATNLFRQKMYPEDILFLTEWTREFAYLKPDTVIVYDRVRPNPGTTYNLRFHFPVAPTLTLGGCYTVSYDGGGIALEPLLAGGTSVIPDPVNLREFPKSETLPTPHRVEQTAANPEQGRFLNIIQVCTGEHPGLSAQYVAATPPVMEGVLYNNDVVLFSTQDLGAAPTLPFSYTLPGAEVRTHTLLNMSGSFNVTATPDGGQTVITIGPGATYTANDQGMVCFSQ